MAATPALPHRPRFAWIDAARGLAAVVVVLQHVLVRSSAEADRFFREVFNPGFSAIVLFFVVSGFVIPGTLERCGTREFWINRVFRIYPLYWVALVTVFLFAAAGHFLYEPGFNPASERHMVANVLAMQQILRTPDALPTFWTLGVELIFYMLCTVLFLKGGPKTVPFVLAALSLVIGALVLLPTLLTGQRLPIGPAMAMLLSAVAGYSFSLFLQGRISARQFFVSGTIMLASLGIIAYIVGNYSLATGGRVEVDPVVMWVSWCGGYLWFFAFYAARNRAFPKVLVYLGVVCYSMYLLHPFLVSLIPTDWNLLLACGLGLLGSIILATLGYRLVEVPAQKLGRRLAKPASGVKKSVAAAGFLTLPKD